MGCCSSKKKPQPTGVEAAQTAAPDAKPKADLTTFELAEPKRLAASAAPPPAVAGSGERDALLPKAKPKSAAALAAAAGGGAADEAERPESDVAEWGAAEVKQWLRSLAMGQYAAAVDANGVTGAKLEAVSRSEEFEQLLGVGSAVHRKKLKANIRYTDTIKGVVKHTIKKSSGGGGLRFRGDTPADVVARNRSSTVPDKPDSKALATVIPAEDYRDRVRAARAKASSIDRNDAPHVAAAAAAAGAGAGAGAAKGAAHKTSATDAGLALTAKKILALPEGEELDDRIAVMVLVMSEPRDTASAAEDAKTPISLARLVDVCDCKNPPLPSRRHVEAEAKDVMDQGNTAGAMTAVLREVAKSAPKEFESLEDAVKTWIVRYLSQPATAPAPANG